MVITVPTAPRASRQIVASVLGTLCIAALATAESEVAAASAAVAEGIRVEAEIGAWPVDDPLEDGITPVKVRIENRSGRSLKLRFRELTLVGSPDERRYAALPLHDVLLGRSGVRVEEPESPRVSFRIAPGYREIFPGSVAFPGHFAEERDYGRYHREHWDPARKPTLQMFERLLPEGVLGAGGLIAGFLYFQEVDPWDPELRLEVSLVDADSSETFGTVVLPLKGGVGESDEPE